MLYLSAIVLAFFLSFVLVTKRKKTPADYLLFAWLAVSGFHMLSYYLFFTHTQLEYPTLVALGFPLPLAHGPFLYLYTRQQTTTRPFHQKQLLHFLPLLLSYLLFTPFYLLPHEQKVAVFRLKGQGFTLPVLVNLYATYLSGVVYIGLSIARLVQYRQTIRNRFSNTEKINFNWLLYLIAWIVIIWVAILFVHEDNVIFGAAAIFVFWLGYFGIRQAQVFHEGPGEVPPPVEDKEEAQAPASDDGSAGAAPGAPVVSITVKYQRSGLTDGDIARLHNRLKVLMDEQKLFTNPDLTLNELAKTLGVHPNHLSQVINSRENKSFYDFVNEYRSREFIRLIAHPSHQQYTLVSIAYDCGFNSKASFNRNFKKYTGLTPTDYIKTASRELA